MRGKRGVAGMSLVLYALLDILLVALFIAAVMIRVNSAVNDQSYYQRFIARDLALTVDALHAAEGSFSMQYGYSTPKKSELDIELKPGSVEIYPASQRGLEKKSASSFLFGQNENLIIGGQALEYNEQEEDKAQGREFFIKKDEDTILLSEKGETQ